MSMSMGTEMPMAMTTPKGGMDSKHHMWMWFHAKIQDTVLFDFWTVNTVGGMVLSCIIVFIMGICFEGIKWLRWRVESKNSHSMAPTSHATMYATITTQSAPTSMRYFDKLLAPSHLIQTFLFGIQIVVSYLLMLVFMTFSLWLCIAVTLGTAFGYYLFGTRHDSDVCRTGHLNSQSTAPSCCS